MKIKIILALVLALLTLVNHFIYPQTSSLWISFGFFTVAVIQMLAYNSKQKKEVKQKETKQKKKRRH